MNNQPNKIIEVATEFSRFPAGRFLTDGPYSGERFREELLIPALRQVAVVEVKLDGVAGYGSSFLEEAFGGLVRKKVVQKQDIDLRIKFVANDDSLVEEIRDYMEHAE